MSSISTHVLDQVRGVPAKGLSVALGHRGEDGAWVQLARSLTDADGRCPNLVPEDHELRTGIYCLKFATGDYFASSGLAAFHPEILVTFSITRPAEPHHIPLLLGPFGYTTYRGT